jgi:hypothetical protein
MKSQEQVKHIERHDPGPLEDWRSSLKNAAQRRTVILDRTPLPTDGTDLLECDCDRAALASLFDDSSERVNEAFALGAGASAAAVLCHTESEGAVELLECERSPRRIPVGDALLTPATWRDGFALACAVRNRDALAILCAPDRIAACQLPAEEADAFWLPYCRALASIALEHDDFSEHADAALAQMQDARIASPEVIA